MCMNMAGFGAYIACILAVVILTRILVRLCTKAYAGNEKLNGKVVIVTGANSGIGFETAAKLATMGARVILGCRNKERGLNAQQHIRAVSGNNDVFFEELDLSSFESIRRFVKRIIAQEAKIDTLVNNAGVFWVPYAKTKDGFELNIGINYLGHFLLTLLLMPLLAASKEARVVTVSSVMHIFGKVNSSTLYCEQERYNFVTAYSNSKLMCIFLMKEMAMRFSGTTVGFYSANPGICLTEIGKDSWLMGNWFFKLIFRPIMVILFKSASEGADTVVFCACDRNISSESGLYYSGFQRGRACLGPNSGKVAEDLFNASLAATCLTHLSCQS